MKKTLWILLFAVTAVTACKKDPKEPGTKDPDAVAFKASASIAADGESAAGIDLKWEANSDRIGLFATSGQSQTYTNIYYTAFSSAAVSQFVSTAADKKIYWKESAGEYNFYAYYPFRTSNNDPSAIPVAIAAEQTGEAGSTLHLKKAGVMYASRENAKQKDGDVILEFKNICGVIKLDISTNERLSKVTSVTLRSTAGETMAFSQGTLDIGDGSVDVKAESVSDKVKLTLTKAVTIASTPVSVYIAVCPGHAGKEIEVSAEVGEETKVLGNIAVPSGGIAAGAITALTIGYDIPNPYPDAIDLSAGGTANTYLVNAAGKSYKFKATVKGNGTARSYEWEQDGYKLTGSYTEPDLAIAPADASVVWYNSPKTAAGWATASPVNIESVLLRNDGYVYFTTPDTFVPGNALVAVFDESNEVLWSWNIWAVEGYDYETAAKPLGSYTVMDRNLGAVKGADARSESDPTEAAWAIGNYYQWGRKDPFPAAADHTNANIGTSSRPMEWGLPTYTPIAEFKKNASSESWGADNMMYSYGTSTGYDRYKDNAYAMSTKHGTSFTIDQAVEASVKYPYKWMSSGTDNNSGTSYMWMVLNNGGKAQNERTAWRYLWGNVGGVDGQKSIYDPCPVGWTVADAAAMGLALSGVSLSGNQFGYYSAAYDLYFPAAGQRQAGFGGSMISGIGSKGALMMATSSASTYGHDTFLRANMTVNASNAADGSAITSHNTYLAAGYQLRCVKEESRKPLPGGSLNGAKAVLMGDFATEDLGKTDEGKAFLAENDFVNKGDGNNTTYNMIFRFSYDVVKQDPACVVIAGGINDIAQKDGYVALEDIFGNVRIMAEWAYAYGSKVVIASVTPADKAALGRDGAAENIVKLNAMLKEYADERGFVYLDYHSALKDDNNALDPDYSTDGSHINAAGYDVMMPLLKDAVDTALNTKGSVPGEGDIKDYDEWEWK